MKRKDVDTLLKNINESTKNTVFISIENVKDLLENEIFPNICPAFEIMDNRDNWSSYYLDNYDENLNINNVKKIGKNESKDIAKISYGSVVLDVQLDNFEIKLDCYLSISCKNSLDEFEAININFDEI